MVFSRLIIEGNAVYEIDDACMEQRRRRLEELERGQRGELQGQERKPGGR
ncbi:MAG: hypothetical protein HFG22_05775 [Lachnospiraceae bacterium]|nr:hypothetical protein [Lachnospiraceae bacterium]